MANGSFTGKKYDEKQVYLYCEWESVPNYSKNTSDVALSVYLRYMPPLELEEGEVVVDMLSNDDMRQTIQTLPVSESGTGPMRTRFLGREEWKNIAHKSDGIKAIYLRAYWRSISAPEKHHMNAGIVVQLDTIPQIPPVLESRRVTRIGQRTAMLTMRASHSMGIKSYTMAVNDREQTMQNGEAIFDNLLPNTQYVASFRAKANNGLSSRTATEIFTTEPIYVQSIQWKKLDPEEPEGICLNENASVSLTERLSVLPEEASIKKLLFTSSNPKVAEVSSAGIVRGVSKGTSSIEIRAADGGAAAASVLVEVMRPVRSIHVANPTVQLPKGKTCRINSFVYPETASNKKLKYVSDKTGVAKVTDTGVIEAVGAGEAVITITVDEGERKNVITSADDADQLQYTCTVKVLDSEEGIVWQDISLLPQGGRWDYQIPAAISTNLLYIWDKLVNVYGYEDMETLEEIDLSGGFGTNIREIKNQLNILERNIDRINSGVAWINPYYKEHKEYHEVTPVREDINRWIQFCADLKYEIDGMKGQMKILSLHKKAEKEAEPLVIKINNKLQYLSIREEFLTNGNNI